MTSRSWSWWPTSQQTMTVCWVRVAVVVAGVGYAGVAAVVGEGRQE